MSVAIFVDFVDVSTISAVVNREGGWDMKRFLHKVLRNYFSIPKRILNEDFFPHKFSHSEKKHDITQINIVHCAVSFPIYSIVIVLGEVLRFETSIRKHHLNSFLKCFSWAFVWTRLEHWKILGSYNFC